MRLQTLMRVRLAALFALLLLSHNCLAAKVDEWRDRTIYQVLTDRYAVSNDTQAGRCDAHLGLYCGGTWRGIQDNLDYVQGMGFDALWISPIVQQLPQRTGDGEAYTAYWQQNLYELNHKFGSRADLENLIDEVHRRDMLLMLDIVVNHMGYAGVGWDVDYSVLYPFNESKYYHEYCVVDDDTDMQNVQDCWLGSTKVSLADLNTTRDDVQQMYGDWIKDLISNYSIDGLRIDTSINVNADFFSGFIDAAGVFATGEVLDGDNSVACQWEDSIGSILNYPLYFPLIRAFTSPDGSVNDLVETIQTTKDNCKDPTAMGMFSENHDQPRFTEYTNDTAQAKNVIAFTMLTDGIPIIYQGQEQHLSGGVSPYMNRAPMWEAGYNTSAPLYKFVAKLNQFRQHVVGTSTNYTHYETWPIWQSMHQLALRKGFNNSQVITVLDNSGELCAPYTIGVPNHGYPAGSQLTEVLTCTNLTVNHTGYINVPMEQGEPRVMYPTDLLYNSSLCGMPDQAPQGTPEVPYTTITSPCTTTVSGTQTTAACITTSPLPVPEPTQTDSSDDDEPHSVGHPSNGNSLGDLCSAGSLPLLAAVVFSLATTSGLAKALFM